MAFCLKSAKLSALVLMALMSLVGLGLVFARLEHCEDSQMTAEGSCLDPDSPGYDVSSLESEPASPGMEENPASPTAVVCDPDHVITSSRVVAIADVHGDLERLETALERAKLVNEASRAEDRHWTGGNTVLVQTGDIMDRGPDTFRIFKFLKRLRREASDAGGCVVHLLGNHELMNLAGDMRYAHPQETENFGGQSARRSKLNVNSKLGSYLRKLPVVARVTYRDEEDPAKEFTTVFAHAGIPSWLAESSSVAEINAKFYDALIDADERTVQRLSVTSKLFLGQGPLWTRKYAERNEQEVCRELDRTLGHLSADRMLVGHTVQQTGQPTIRCSGRLVLADTGMSRAYGGGYSLVEFSAHEISLPMLQVA